MSRWITFRILSVIAPEKATESRYEELASNGNTDLRQSNAIADIIQVERNRDTTGLWVMIALEKTRNFNYLADFYLILEPFWNVRLIIVFILAFLIA